MKYGYITVAIPKDETFSYAALHALARSRNLSLGEFVRALIEEHCAAEINAHHQFADTVAQMHRSMLKSIEGKPEAEHV